jgi:hypothetical protein
MTSSHHPSVVVISGGAPGAVLRIDEVLNDFSIGADEGCHLVVVGDSVSPMHAALFLDDAGQVSISDTNSRFGVFVNGVKVREQALSHGDEISLGDPGDPQCALLRFVGAGMEADESGSSEPIDLGLGEPQPMELPPMELPGMELPSAPESSADAFPPLDLPGEAQPLPDANAFAAPEPLSFPELAPLPEAEPVSAAYPEPSPELSPEPFPEPEALPAFEALPEPPAELPAFEPPAFELPAAEPQPEPEPAPAPAPTPRPAPKPAAKPAPKPVAKLAPKAPAARKATPKAHAGEDADDPLAGLAESLGGHSDEPFEPPPPVEDAPAPAAAPKKEGPSIALKVARVGVVALVLVAGSWFAFQKYSESFVIPVVDTYLPNPVEPGQLFTINGSGFGTDPDPTVVKVTLGKIEVPVLDANPTRINLNVPESFAAAGTQTVNLHVTAQGTRSVGRLLKITVVPKITSLTPRVALTGDEVAVVGKWLVHSKTPTKVTVAGNEAEILEATATRIRFKVPEVTATEGQRVSVRVAVGEDVSKEALLNFGRMPFIESISPVRALPGEVVTLTGLGLAGPDLAVNLSGRAAAVLSATDTEIRMSLPGLRLSEGAGERSLTMQANEKTSIPHPIEVLRESAGLYSPRFFVEVVESGRAAVACELGPVMVLGADPASRQRAHDAAAKLNALVASGRATRVEFTTSGATINARGGAVLVVAAADGSGNPSGLAALWAAQLSDMFDLFLQGRRPGRTVEMSPEGRVFLDMFTAARRRSAEPGVPQGLLYSLDPAWARSLAALATRPTMGSGEALALLDGRWAGVIEVPGGNKPRPVEISLTATPSGLVGQRTSRQGRLSSDVTLRDLRYDRRQLSFSFTDTGEELTFTGRLDGDAITGAVTKAAGGRLGPLTLKLTR